MELKNELIKFTDWLIRENKGLNPDSKIWMEFIDKYLESQNIKTEPKTLTYLSNEGFDFNDKPITEDTITKTVLYKGKIYNTGNRRNDLVELYEDGKFYQTIGIRHICLIEERTI